MSKGLIRLVFEFLNTNCIYAVLRNYEGLPDNKQSRDMDILVDKRGFLKIRKELINIIENCGYKLCLLYRSDMKFSFICTKIEETPDLIQFDFLFNASIFGLFLVDEKEMLQSRIFNGSIWHVTEEYEFLDKYLEMKVLKKQYPLKYKALKDKMEHSKFIYSFLKENIDCFSLPELDNLSSGKFVFILIKNNLLKRPFIQIRNIISFSFYYTINIFSCNGFSIGFSGPDGSGKTTIIDNLSKEFGKVFPVVVQFHFRPTLFDNLGEAAERAKLKKNVDKNFSQPHRGGKTSIPSSIIRLCYYSSDYIIGYFTKIRKHLYRRNVILFDRYYTDIITDSRRSRIYLNKCFLYYFGKAFIPSLDYNILISADTKTILARKQELDEDAIDNINKNLTFLSKKKGYYLIKNNGEPFETVQNVLRIIVDEQHRKIQRRF